MATDAHLVLPAFFGLAFADGAVDEPAELAGLKFPGGALFPALGGAIFDGPARFDVTIAFSRAGEQKQNLPFGVGRDLSPALFIAVQGLERNAKELRQFFLGLAELFSD